MGFEIARVIQTAIAIAVLETLISAYPFHPFYPLPTTMYAVIEVVFYLVAICIAAFIATRIPTSAGWTQKVVFFILVVTPSLILSYFFYRGVSFYWQGGRPLVTDHHLTTAGLQHLLSDLGKTGLLALVATLIYFRTNPQTNQASSG